MKKVGAGVSREVGGRAFPPDTRVPQDQGEGSAAPRLIRAAILLIGVFAQVAGTLGGISGAIDSPLIALLVASMGFAMVVSVLVQMVAAKRKPIVLVILAGGESVRLTSKYRPGARTLAAVGLVVAVGGFGWYARRTMPRIGGPVIQRAVDYDVYPHRYLNGALVDSTYGRLSRFSTYSGRINDEDRLDHGMRFTTAASISRRNTFYGATTLDYQTFAVEFDLQARPAYSPVKVEAIRVIIDAYEPLPRYEVPVGGGPVTSVVPFYMYNAVLEKPIDGRPREVLARSVAVEDTPPSGPCAYLCLRRPDGGDVFVTADEPTAFLVKIEPRERGFYGFSVEVMLSSGLELQRSVVASHLHVLFY